MAMSAPRQPAVPSAWRGLDTEDDAGLVARCRNGESAAWTALVNRYQRLIHAITRRAGLDPHAGADVFQTVFERLFEHLPRLSAPERLQAWIVTTTKREALRQRAAGVRLVSMDDEAQPGQGEAFELPDPAPLAEDALAHLQQLHQIRQGLERLDDRCRTLLMLVFRDEDSALPYDEVARRLNSPLGSIGPTRARCLDKLRRLVQAPP